MLSTQNMTGPHLAVRSGRFRHTADVLSALIGRDMKLRYRRSLLGVLWTLLNPLAELLVFLFVFGYVLAVNIPHYTAYLFIGVLVYNWFQTSLFYSAHAILGNRELVRQPGFPQAILPIVTVATNLVHFLLALPILMIVLFMSGIALKGAALLLPLLVAVQFIFTLGLAYIVAACQVRFRDTQYLLKVVLQLLFFLSPVFYTADAVPPRFQPLYRLNPLVFLIDAYRSIFLAGEIPDLAMTCLLTTLFGVVLIGGLAAFRSASHRFVEELG